MASQGNSILKAKWKTGFPSRVLIIDTVVLLIRVFEKLIFRRSTSIKREERKSSYQEIRDSSKSSLCLQLAVPPQRWTSSGLDARALTLPSIISFNMKQGIT